MCRISTGILYPIRSSNTCQFNTSVSFKFGRYISPHFIILVTYVLQAVQVVLPSCSVDTWCNYRTRTSKAIKKTVYTTVRFMKFKMASPCPFQNNSPVDKAESMTSSSLRRYRVIPSTDASTWMPTSKTERKFFRRSSSRNRLVSSLRCSHTRTGR